MVSDGKCQIIKMEMSVMSHLGAGYSEFDPEAAICGLILGTLLTQILLVAMYPTFSHYPMSSKRAGFIPHFVG